MNIKLIDMGSANFEADLISSLEETGFVVLDNHGIPESYITKAQDQWKEFFLKSQNFKNLFVNGNNPNMGYKGMRTETAVGAKKADLKEYFHWKPDQEIPEDVKDSTAYLYFKLSQIASKILRIIDLHGVRNGYSSNYREECYGSDNTIVRPIYYPEMDFDADSGAVRAAAHEDINCITLLVAASAPGLQAMDKSGQWIDVPHKANVITVNIGDMLQLASNGRYKSTTHRVVNMPGDRISMPLFVHPHGDTVLAPGKTAAQYLAERIAQIHGSKK